MLRRQIERQKLQLILLYPMKACKPPQTLSETHPHHHHHEPTNDPHNKNQLPPPQIHSKPTTMATPYHHHYEPIDDPQQKSKQNPQNLNPKGKTDPKIHLKIKPIANSNPKPIRTHPKSKPTHHCHDPPVHHHLNNTNKLYQNPPLRVREAQETIL